MPATLESSCSGRVAPIGKRIAAANEQRLHLGFRSRQRVDAHVILVPHAVDNAAREQGDAESGRDALEDRLERAELQQARRLDAASGQEALEPLSLRVPVERGAVWTTDAPFRETEQAITTMQAKGLLAVEMEAAALYAFAQARCKPVVCFAHVTNQMARREGDFEKGEADGAVDALALVAAVARAAL